MNGWTDGHKPRAVCRVCGTWKEYDHDGFMFTFFEGLIPGSPEYQAAAECRIAMRSFMETHLRHCVEAGGIETGAGLVFLYPDQAGYDDLDPYKEDVAAPK